MAGYNKVILIGNLTRDPELRYTPKGVAIAKLGLAVNRSWRDVNTNELKEEVTFIDVDAFSKQAETLAKYVKKGSPIMIEGRLRLDTWEDKQTNQKRSRLGVVLEGFQFLDFRGGAGGEAGAGAGGGQARPKPSAPPGASSPGPGPSNSAPPSDIEEPPPAEDDVPF